MTSAGAPVPRLLQSIDDTYRAFPRAFWLLMTGTFVDRLGTNLVIPFLAIYVVQRFHTSFTQVGVIYTIFAISSALGNFLAGALADRFGRRLTLILGLALAGTARAALGLAGDMTGVYTAAVFAGLFGAIGWPAQLAMTADLLGPERRASGFGVQRVVINSTFALGPMAGAFLAPHIGYLPLFLADALTSYAVAFVIFAKLPETRPKPADGASEGFVQTLMGYGKVLRDGTFITFILISILIVAAFMQMSTTLSLFLVNTRGMSESFFGSLVMLNALMVVFLQIPISRWASRKPLFLIMALGSALYLVGFGSYGWVSTAGLFVAAMFVITLGEMLVIPSGQALTALLAPGDMRARYVAMERFNWIIAQSLGPLAASVIMDRLDARWVWHGCSIVCAIGALGFLALYDRTRSRLGQGTAQSVPTRGSVAGWPRNHQT